MSSLIEHLTKVGLDSEGIFREAPSAAQVNAGGVAEDPASLWTLERSGSTFLLFSRPLILRGWRVPNAHSMLRALTQGLAAGHHHL